MTNSSNYTINNGIHVDITGPDEAVGYVDVSDISMNQKGFVHGGLYFSLADSVAGAAAYSLGQAHVTLNATIDFMKPVATGRLRAVGKTASRTRAICVVNVELFDDKDQLVNQGTYTMFNLERK